MPSFETFLFVGFLLSLSSSIVFESFLVEEFAAKLKRGFSILAIGVVATGTAIHGFEAGWDFAKLMNW